MPRIRDLASHPYPFVTVEELASYLDVSEKTIYRHEKKGAIRFVRVGGTIVKIPIDDARRYAAGERPPDNGDDADNNGHPSP